jgi:DNA modification methylase
MTELSFHPLCEIFPLLEGAEFDALVADIAAHGLHEPIVVLDDQILDGRNRYRGCQVAGIEPRFRPYTGGNPAAYVVSRNLHRRHLDESQRAMVAAKLATLGHGANQGPSGKFAARSDIPTQATAAEMLNVSERTVRTARVVVEHGAPELRQAVELGKVSVSVAADVATMPVEQQGELVARGEREILEAAKNIRGKRAEARRAAERLREISQRNVPTPKLYMGQSQIFRGDIRELASTLPVADCVVTSPPYYQQRCYSTETDPREIGREKTVEEYIATLVSIFSSLNIAPYGSLWVNINDKRDGCGGLLGIPELFVAAMKTAGWCLIERITWVKEIALVDGTSLGTMMREPAPGRCNGNGSEPFYRFARDPQKAWSDTSAVALPRENFEFPGGPAYPEMECVSDLHGRSIGNVWHIPGDRSRSGEQRRHCAVYPRALVERPIAMTCPLEITQKGKPVTRDVLPTEYDDGKDSGWGKQDVDPTLKLLSGRMDTGRRYVPRYPKDLGWKYDDDDPVARRGLVLDPFAGTGTTGEVALRLGRSFVGVELYPETIATISPPVRGEPATPKEEEAA